MKLLTLEPQSEGIFAMTFKNNYCGNVKNVLAGLCLTASCRHYPTQNWGAIIHLSAKNNQDILQILGITGACNLQLSSKVNGLCLCCIM